MRDFLQHIRIFIMILIVESWPSQLKITIIFMISIMSWRDSEMRVVIDRVQRVQWKYDANVVWTHDQRSMNINFESYDSCNIYLCPFDVQWTSQLRIIARRYCYQLFSNASFISWLIIFVETWLCPPSLDINFSWKININNTFLHQSRSSTSRSSRLFFDFWQSITRRSFFYNLNDIIRSNEIHDVDERSPEKKHKIEASCWFQYAIRESKIPEHDIFTKIF